jgi:hypothetical protein
MMAVNRVSAAHGIDPGDARWREFLGGSTTATVFHSSEWMQALTTTYGYECRVLVSSDSDGQVTGGLPYCVMKALLSGRRVVSLPFSDYCGPLATSPVQLEQLLIGIKTVLQDACISDLEMRGCGGGGVAHSLGFSPGERFLRHVIELGDGLERVEGRYHKSCVVRKVARARRESVQVVCGTGCDEVEAFYRLLVITRRRHGYPPPPLEWFKCLAKVLPGSSFVVLKHMNRPVAAIVSLRFNDVVYYKYGASDERFHHLGVMPFLYAYMVKSAFESGALRVDLGRTELSNTGLADFKERFGAVRSEVVYWRYGSPRSSSFAGAGALMKMARFVVSKSPRALLPHLGNILYPHSG